MNYAVNLQALDHFGGRGAKVTLDIWDGLGHRLPYMPNSEYLEQWLLIEAHKGRIEVESEEGVGTCFYFTLPEAV